MQYLPFQNQHMNNQKLSVGYLQVKKRHEVSRKSGKSLIRFRERNIDLLFDDWWDFGEETFVCKGDSRCCPFHFFIGEEFLPSPDC